MIIMKWSEVREHYPNKFVLIESLKAYSSNNKRYIEDMTVVSCYDDTKKAWEDYKKLRKDSPTRELYIFHTSKENVEVVEQAFSGVRGVV